MKFGPVPVSEAGGAVLAHSLQLDDGRLRKGRVLSEDDVARLTRAGFSEVVVARAEPGDMAEDAAAAALADALLFGGATGLQAEAAFTGRVNLRAEGAGVLRVDEAAIARINSIDPAVTLATLPPWQRVTAGMMVATVKIIPYAVAETAVAQAVGQATGALTCVTPALRSASLIVTQLAGAGGEDKAVAVTQARLSALGVSLEAVETVPHDAASIAASLARMPGELVLILTGSATSDEADVGPAGLVAAGGQITRFGMPVDPGNLLFYGDLRGRWVIGLPGCARSPALNGADWVMERIICGAPPTAAEIAMMGVGGLLKEIPTRPQPRERRRGAPDLAAP